MKRTLIIAAFAFLTLCLISDASAQKVRLRAQITPTCANSGNLKFADIYAEGNIAVQGSYNCRGAFIYDISNPDNPVLASWYNPGANQQFLEAIVVGNRGYFGSGNSGGVHIVDLSSPVSPQHLGTVNAGNGNGHNSIHEMMVFSQNGATYLLENSNSTFNKILKVINVTNPATPVFVRDISPTEVQWVHAMHIRGNRLFTSGWGNSTNRAKTEIYDISNIATQAPVLLGSVIDMTGGTTSGNNMHSSWTSEDGNYLYSARETSNGNGDVRVYDITNPATPLLVNRLTMQGLGLNAVTPHNPVVMGNYLYVSWYQAGVQVFDISTPSEPKRVGQYDTYGNAFAPPEAEKLALLEAEPWDMVCGSEFRQNVLPTSYDGNWAVFPFLGQNKVLAGDLKHGLLVLDATGVASSPKNTVSDFDGDGKTDLSVYNPATGQWQIEKSSDSEAILSTWGITGDKLVPGDYDGDGRSDIAVWRPSTGIWYIIGSGGTVQQLTWGVEGDIPVAADYDADGRTDVAIWRPSNGQWHIMRSTLGYLGYVWGVNGDKPLTGDYEGDGKADAVVWRPSNGTWYVIPSSSSLATGVVWGQTGDKPLYADFDGDGKSEYTVFRPSTGEWFVMNLAQNSIAVQHFGEASDAPIPADFDGDGKADIAVFRPGTNMWYWLSSSSPEFHSREFGHAGDSPSPASIQPQ